MIDRDYVCDASLRNAVQPSPQGGVMIAQDEAKRNPGQAVNLDHEPALAGGTRRPCRD